MKGIGTSTGISIGKAFLKIEPEIKIVKKHVDDPEKEILRLDNAIEESVKDIDDLYSHTLNTVGKEEADIFSAHLMILKDPEFIGQVKKEINNSSVNAEWAINKSVEDYSNLFATMEDEYIKERILDLKDVSKRLLFKLLNIKSVDLSELKEECIIVCVDLTPSDTAQMRRDKVLGFVTEQGGRTSHTAIMARTLEIPAVAGVSDITKKVKDGDMLIIDGEKGVVILNPTEKEIAEYKEKKKSYEEFVLKLKEMKGKPTLSKDGIKVEIAGNIGTPKDIDKVIENDGEGVGLYRTEFLYMDNDKLPTEDEQFKAYKVVAEKLQGKPLVIRTLDVGGDKEIPYLNLPKEMNPFLGYRAIRLCLDRKDIFKTQLRAILRASIYGNVKIMFPMVSNIAELREAKKILEEVKKELESKNIPFAKDIEVGIMVEIPSTAIQSDIFAKEVDFFSIGTNDLIQYTLAVDRGNQNISYLYSQYHPAVLRLINMTIKNGHKAGIWVGMCGEAAGDAKLIPLLLGMGLDEFSMSSSSILKARWTISKTSKKESEELVNKALNLSTIQDVEDLLNKINVE